MPHLEIQNDEALVLFELLSRYSETDELKTEYAGERTALMSLLFYLEKQLVDSFRDDYTQLLAQARARLAERAGEGE